MTSSLTCDTVNSAMPKYDSMRKLDRNQVLEEYADQHPDATLEQIGKVFNISKQRVHELLKAATERKMKEAATPEKVTA